MSFIRTSRSRLADRVVRVDRRRPVDDGMGGEVDSFTTIIPRLWLAIYPAQHQERRRSELGEQPLSATHIGLADTTRNGATIMVGDRFVDEKNNEWYDVLGVPRPQHKSPHQAMTQFTLRNVKDGHLQQS